MTSEKHQPFEQNTRKEENFLSQNIEGHSEEVGLYARTNSFENDKELTALRSSECNAGRTMGHKRQNKSKKASLDVKNLSNFIGGLKITRVKIGGKFGLIN